MMEWFTQQIGRPKCRRGQVVLPAYQLLSLLGCLSSWRADVRMGEVLWVYIVV